MKKCEPPLGLNIESCSSSLSMLRLTWMYHRSYTLRLGSGGPMLASPTVLRRILKSLLSGYRKIRTEECYLSRLSWNSKSLFPLPFPHLRSLSPFWSWADTGATESTRGSANPDMRLMLAASCGQADGHLAAPDRGPLMRTGKTCLRAFWSGRRRRGELHGIRILATTSQSTMTLAAAWTS